MAKQKKAVVPEPTKEQIKALVALRDAVVRDFVLCQRAADNDSEFTTRLGNGVNCSEALATLRPLFEMASQTFMVDGVDTRAKRPV